MGMPAETARRWTAREVRDLIAAQSLHTPRYELVDGELLVTPSPAPPHQVAARLIVVALSTYLEREGLAEVLYSPSDVELEPEDLRQPDVFVVTRDELRRVIRDGNPVRELLLAVEVLSPSSGRHDRVTKRPGYQRHVPEYWIIDLESRLVERWRPGDDRPEILTQAIVWQGPGSTEPLTMSLPGFFVRAFAE
jgi:Uma2 family endonuclease